MRQGSDQEQTVDQMLDYLLDPIAGSPAAGRTVLGIVALHVDDLFMTGNAQFEQLVISRLRKDYQVGSEDRNDLVFTGQHVKWTKDCIVVDQDRAIEELSEISLAKGLKDDDKCSLAMHTEYRSVLGSLNWLQSRTQFQIAYKFSGVASATAAPTIGDVRE